MKNALGIIIVASIINSNVFAQTKPDSVRVRKNEINMDLLPLIMLGSTPNKNIPVSHIFYKRYLKNNWYGRASVAVLGNTELYDNSFYTTQVIKTVNNSKLSIQYTEKQNKPHFQYNIGIEKRWGKGYLKQFSGLDIGYYNSKVETKEMYGYRDSLSSGNPYSYGTNEQQKFKTDSIITHQQKNVNAILLSPFYGIQLNISKRLFFSAQVGFDFKTSFDNVKTIVDNRDTKLYSGRNTNFDFEFVGVSNNISLGFRF